MMGKIIEDFLEVPGGNTPSSVDVDIVILK